MVENMDDQKLESIDINYDGIKDLIIEERRNWY